VSYCKPAGKNNFIFGFSITIILKLTDMTSLSFHLLTIKVLVRIKKKGCMYSKLTHRDRVELVVIDKIGISISHIHKVLSDSDSALWSFNQDTMDKLARYVGFKDWNDFMKHYPLPDDIEPHTGMVTGKVKDKLEKKIYEMLKKYKPGNTTEKP